MADDTPKRALPLALIPFAILFLALMYAGIAVEPPPVRTTSAANQFDAHAARERFARVMADESPHAVDTLAEDAQRERLLRAITALGLHPEVHASFACRPSTQGPFAACAYVRNIVFSIGPVTGPAVLAASHYDSVPAGPGASDDGLGVSAWLQIASVLSHEQLRRRVIFLISDGEEGGLIGAYAFRSDPLFHDVQALVNVDMRGTRGPAIFFETNQPNADAVRAFAPAPRGIANSVAADVYSLLPNSTDVSALTQPGLDVINIAVIGGLENYHTRNDSLANSDLRSLQHIGDIALDVTRRWANTADGGDRTEMVYTDIASRLFVFMPSWAGLTILALSALIAFGAFWRTGNERRWRTLAAPFAGFVLAGVLAGAAGLLFGIIHPGADLGFAHPEPARAWCALFAMLGAVMTRSLLRASMNAQQAEAAGAFWFAMIGVLLTLLLPGASILFALPMAPYALGCLIALAWKPAQMLGAVLTAFVALIIWTPALAMIEVGLGFTYPFANAMLDFIPALAFLGLAVRFQNGGSWRGAIAVLAVAAVGFFVASIILPSATVAKPQPLNLTYVVNTTDNRALILAGSAEGALPRELGGGFHAETLIPGDRSDSWVMPTALVPTPAPALENLAATEEGGERTEHARLVMNGAHRAIIRFPLTAQPLRAVVNGVPVDFSQTGSGGDTMSLACEGRSCDGADISIAFSTQGEAGDWTLIGQYPGAPPPPAVAAMRARRPATAIPIQFGDGTATLTTLRPFH